MRKFIVVVAMVAVGLMVVGCGDNGGDGGDSPDDSYTGRTVQLGGLTWMADNLNINTANSWCYDDESENCEKYGRLYTWDAAISACRGLGNGWRLPDTSNLNALIRAIGGEAGSAAKLKSKAPDWDGTDEFGFSALPGGRRETNGRFIYADYQCRLWSATEHVSVSGNAWTMSMSTGFDNVSDFSTIKDNGLSVRCVR